jgi:hypothetical protein
MNFYKQFNLTKSSCPKRDVIECTLAASAIGPQVRQEKSGTQRIEEYLHSKYGRLQIGPHDIIRIVFNLHNVFFLGGANL